MKNKINENQKNGSPFTEHGLWQDFYPIFLAIIV